MLVDQSDRIDIRRFIDPVSNSDNTAIVSEIIDTANFGSLTMLLMFGSIASGSATFAVLVEDGDDSGLTDNAAVADDFLIGTETGAAPLFSDDNSVAKIGYIGPKRYVRLTLTPSGNSSAFLKSGIAILGGGRTGLYTTQTAS